MNLDQRLSAGTPPVIAILRGIRPEECESIGAALCDAGIGLIEVPLNSPQPLESISRLAKGYGTRCLVGAGTVLSAGAVDDVFQAGGRLIVTPTAEAAVIAHTVAAGLDIVPGFETPTEALPPLQPAQCDSSSFRPRVWQSRT